MSDGGGFFDFPADDAPGPGAPEPAAPQPGRRRASRRRQDEARPSGPVKTRKVKVGGKPFSQRNPTVIGAIGLVVILVILYAAFNASKLPIIGGGTTYSAYFTEDAGLGPSDDVTIAGIKVGTVSSTSLDSALGVVKVSFKVKNGFIGNQSTVAIGIKTLLGAKYLDIDSIGTVKQNPGQTIPTSRTTSPLDIYPAFTELTQTVNSINTTALAQAFTALAQDFAGTPASVKPVLTGLSRLSTTIASRDNELQILLAKANGVTGVLAGRDQQLQQLLSDGNLLLQELNDRSSEIQSLLVNTTALSQQLQGLVADNEKTIGPMLSNLHGVLNLLQANQDDLDRSLQLLAPFYRVFANALGNGRWFDNYICNLGVGGLVGFLPGHLDNNDSGCLGTP